MLAHFLTLFWQSVFKVPFIRERWAQRFKSPEFQDSPWTPLTKPLSECRVCLLTTGGLHLHSDPPFDMSDPQGDPTFRTIPLDSLQSDWRITHNYYDHTDAEQDFNLIFPLEHLRELQRSGEIGALTSRHFSLMGHIEEVHVPTLLHQTSRKLANLLREEYADIALLVPA